MRNLATLLLLLALATSALADLEQDVRCREVGFSKSVESLDHELFASFIDPDARFIGGKVDRGRENIAEAWKVFFAADSPSIKWRPQFIEVLESANLALSRGPYRMQTKDDDGNEIERWGTFNSIWRLGADGQWRVVFDAGSPAASEPDEQTKALLDEGDDCS